MSDPVTISIISGVVALLSLIIGGVISVRLKKIHQQINSRMDELLKLTRKDSKAEGNLEGRKDLKHEQDDKR